MNEKTIKIIAPAKVNLFLAVGEKQGDMHPVINVMHSLILHDVLYMSYKSSDQFSVSVEMMQSEDADVECPDVAQEDNLVYKAITKLASVCKAKKVAISVFVEKNIPYQAGLGGGSSDAAAALVGAAEILGISKEDSRILECAKALGSDVPFFLTGGCAMFKGKGEIFDHKIQPINRDIVLVKPQGSLSTKKVYSAFDEINAAADFDELTGDMKVADNIPLFNNLAFASEQLLTELVEIREFLASKSGEDNVLLCGSGSASFAFSEDPDSLVKECRDKGWWACRTSLANVKCRIIPVVSEL